MNNWVLLDTDKRRIVQHFNRLPECYKNVSNFANYPKPQEYGFYKYYEIKPTYDPVYEKLAIDSKTANDETGQYIVKYKVIDLSIEELTNNALNKVQNIEVSLRKEGFEFEGLTFLSSDLSINELLIEFMALDRSKESTVAKSIRVTDITGQTHELTAQKAKGLVISLLQHRDKVKHDINKLTYLVYSTNTKKGFMELNKLLNKPAKDI